MFTTLRKYTDAVVGVLSGAALCWLALGASGGAQLHETATKGFLIEKEVSVPLKPAAAFDAFTGDISPWWDHHFSQEPTRLMIEPRPGGHFVEAFDDAGNGVIHGLVTWSERGKKLVIRGWLGPFHSTAGIMVHTFSFVPAESGTKLKASIRMVGEFDAEAVRSIDRVWDHLLIERFKPYAERRSNP